MNFVVYDFRFLDDQFLIAIHFKEKVVLGRTNF